MNERFADRRSAGIALAAKLVPLRGSGAIVLALPRGGVPVAAEIATALGLPLDILLVRKVGLPHQPELALAALSGAEGQTLVVNDDVARMAHVSRPEIDRLAAPQRAELARRKALWLGDRPPPRLQGRPVILVDDGIATGATTRAAIAALRAEGAGRITLAIPVAPPETLEKLRDQVDEVVCLATPIPFFAVGAHYDAFPQVEDAEVRATLDRLRPPPESPAEAPVR